MLLFPGGGGGGGAFRFLFKVCRHFLALCLTLASTENFLRRWWLSSSSSSSCFNNATRLVPFGVGESSATHYTYIFINPTVKQTCIQLQIKVCVPFWTLELVVEILRVFPDLCIFYSLLETTIIVIKVSRKPSFHISLAR